MPAGADLAEAVQTIGLSASPRYLAEANRRAVEAVEDGEVPGVVKVAATDAGVGLAGIVLGGLLLGGYLASRGAKPPAPSSPTPLPPVIVEAKPDPVPLPEPKEGETFEDVLKPGGKLVGQEGAGDRVRELPGGTASAEELFDRLKQGGTETPGSGSARRRVVFPDGSSVQYRPDSTSGPPTIDVAKPGLGIRKLKFP